MPGARRGPNAAPSWNWHAWLITGKDAKKDREWLGQFRSTEDALAWKAKAVKAGSHMGKKVASAEVIVIDNVPPTRAQREGWKPTSATTTTTSTKTEAKTVKKVAAPKVAKVAPKAPTAEERELRDLAKDARKEHVEAEAAELAAATKEN